MKIDREYWKKQFAGRKWEEIFDALGIDFKKDRGGKYRPICSCSECGYEQTVVCYLDGKFRCTKCKVNGEMIDYIIETAEIFADIYTGAEDEDVQEIFDNLPKVEDRRQMWLFSPKHPRLILV